MTSRERVRAALTGKLPDQVPIVEFVVDPKVAFALVPDARDVAEACDRLDLDSVGSAARFLPVAEYGDEYVDEWGVRYRRGPQVVAHPLRGPISSKDDLRRWQPPNPDAPHRLEGLHDVVARFKGRRAILFHHRAAFMWSAYLTGLDRLLELFYEDPGFVHDLFEKVMAVNERIIRNAIRAGAEVVCLGDDYASNQGPLFSSAMFRQFVLPYLRRAVHAIHEEGALAVKHSDGNLWPILDDIVKTGVEGLNPIEPTAGMDLAAVKAAYGDRVCLIGNIDCGELLSRGTPEAVAQAVREAIRVGAPGGRFMLSSSNSIHASVKPENFRAMILAGRRWGAGG
ncbi:MAG: uroporphyrinogen decarboxylase family protein [Armatimonadota bacterium]|nr:uroporphyrinogen decarboxylase family protein [Armatimonadota bacterium]